MMVLFFLGLSSAFAQSSKETIVIDKVFLGHKYYHGDQQIMKIRDMKAIVANDELALKEVKKAGVANGFATVLSCIGGFALGWELGNAILGKDTNPYVLGASLGVTAVGIGLSALVDSHLKKGATIYNGNLGATSCGNGIELEFGFVPAGVGLTLSF